MSGDLRWPTIKQAVPAMGHMQQGRPRSRIVKSAEQPRKPIVKELPSVGVPANVQIEP